MLLSLVLLWRTADDAAEREEEDGSDGGGGGKAGSRREGFHKRTVRSCPAVTQYFPSSVYEG